MRERLRPQASYCYLLDADADLAQEFDLRMRVVVRQVATVVVFEIPIGEHAPSEWLEPGLGGLGLLLLAALIIIRLMPDGISAWLQKRLDQRARMA